MKILITLCMLMTITFACKAQSSLLGKSEQEVRDSLNLNQGYKLKSRNFDQTKNSVFIRYIPANGLIVNPIDHLALREYYFVNNELKTYILTGLLEELPRFVTQLNEGNWKKISDDTWVSPDLTLKIKISMDVQTYSAFIAKM